jgi:hypothetical protein
VISLLSPPPLAGSQTCLLAEALAQSHEESRAILYWNRCHQFEADPEVRRKIATLKKSLQKKSLAPVSLSLSPSSATARVDKGFDEEDILLNDEDLWLPVGDYRIEVRAEGYEEAAFKIQVESSDRMLMPLSLEKKAVVTPTEIDLGEDENAELGSVATTADPRPKKFKTLLADRYRRAPDPELVEADEKEDSLLWPALSAAGGLALVGTGVALHLRDRDTAAYLSYGAGAGLLGVSTYLLLRDDDDDDPSGARISALPGGMTLGFGGRW